MPTSVCPQPGVAMVHTFRKIYVTACHRHEPDTSYCHWSAKRYSCAKNKLICPIHFCFGFFIIPVMNVRPKNSFTSSTVMGTQVRYKVYPVNGYYAAFMA